MLPLSLSWCPLNELLPLRWLEPKIQLNVLTVLMYHSMFEKFCTFIIFLICIKWVLRIKMAAVWNKFINWFFNCPLGWEAQFYTFIFVETKRMFCWHLMSFCSKKYCITNNKRCNKNYGVPFLSMMPENEFWLEKPLDPNKKYWISIYS